MGNELNLLEGLYISLSSMSLVFIILILLSLVLSSFKYIFKEKDRRILNNKVTNQANKELALTDDNDDEKVVVALAASIMAGKGKVNPNFHIKSIKRIK